MHKHQDPQTFIQGGSGEQNARLNQVCLIPGSNFPYNSADVIPILGDGNCGYGCVASRLNGENRSKHMATLNTYLGDSSQITAANLRRLLVEGLINGKYLYIYLRNERGLLPGILHSVNARAGKAGSDGWATDEEFTVLATIFQVRIVIYISCLNELHTSCCLL